MTPALTTPLTPPDCDLRGLDFMPLDAVRLRDSDLAALATGDEFRAAVLLWCAAWGQVPAGSLPPDARSLARFAGVNLAEWERLSAMALHGWVKCSDGRLYHRVVAEKALAAWIDRLKYRKRSEAANSKRYGKAWDPASFDRRIEEAQRLLAVLMGVSGPVLLEGADVAPSRSEGAPTRTVFPSEGRGKEKEKEKTPPERAAPVCGDPNALAWTRGVALLASAGRMSEGRARSFFGRLLKGPPALEARELLSAIASAEGNSTQDPQSYLTKAARAICERHGAASGPVTAAWDEATWRTACVNFRNDGAWSAEMGPEPGEPGCIVPGGVLDEFGWAA